MIFRTVAYSLILLALASTSLHATVHLLLDERLKKSPLEQVIYKFVPLTSASEVELSYVRDFLTRDHAAEYLQKLRKGDHALYIGADAWPSQELSGFFSSAALAAFEGKIDFLSAPAESGANVSTVPKRLLDHRDLWRRFAELTGARYAGHFEKHYLDAGIESLGQTYWDNFRCVHEAGLIFTAGRSSPVITGRDGFRLNFRLNSQLPLLGRLICINTPKADAFFEISTYKGDVELLTRPGRFSAWNEAQPLKLHIASTRQISAPLFLEVNPEVNQDQVEFFFQGDRISCKDRRCVKKAARFLLPAMTGLTQDLEIAVRATGDSYFRGLIKLRTGEIEVARAEIRFLPASWLMEFAIAMKHPSEYKSFFLRMLMLALAGALCLVLLVFLGKRLRHRLALRQKPTLPRQTSAGVRIAPETKYRLTASQNPFGCELAYFGGIIDLQVSGEKVRLKNGERPEELYDLKNFRVHLADGYVLKVRQPGGSEIFLEAYLIS